MHAQGAYQSALPDIKGRAVVALAYRFQPAPRPDRQQVVTVLTSFVQIDNAVIRAIGRMGGSLVQKKADTRGPYPPARLLEGEPRHRGQPRRGLREGARAPRRTQAGAGGVPEAAGRAVSR